VVVFFTPGGAVLFNAAGEVATECCCKACQWAIDFRYLCVGACNGTSWEEGHNDTFNGGDHEADPWAAFTSYSFGDLVMEAGTKYACKIAHTSGAAFVDTNWIDASAWVVAPGTQPYEVQTDISASETPPTPGLHIDGCNATRYGAIHWGGDCPGESDVVEDVPVSGTPEDDCSACHQCYFDNICHLSDVPCGLHFDVVIPSEPTDDDFDGRLGLCDSGFPTFNEFTYSYNPPTPPILDVNNLTLTHLGNGVSGCSGNNWRLSLSVLGGFVYVECRNANECSPKGVYTVENNAQPPDEGTVVVSDI